MSLKYLVVILCVLFVSCNRSNNTAPMTKFPEVLPAASSTPVITSSFASAADPGIFETAFVKDTKVKEGEYDFNFYRMDIGNIKVESGKLIACDPAYMFDSPAFSQKFPVGSFPVQLAIAKTKNDERCAFSRIVFMDHPVVRWDCALTGIQQPMSICDTNIYCYAVDSGTGLFIDSVAASVFARNFDNEYEKVFVNKAEQNDYKGFVHDFSGHNLATFPSGYGDGCYASFVGYDKEGNICQLLTDFGLVNWCPAFVKQSRDGVHRTADGKLAN